MYDVIEEPPLDDGAVKDTEAEVNVALETTGAAGRLGL